MRVDYVSTTGKWSLAQDEMGVSVAEPVVISEKWGSWRGARILELLIVEGQEGRHED